MIADVIVRPLAETDVREAAFWYESKREGLGAEFTLELDALYERIATPVGGEPPAFAGTGSKSAFRRTDVFTSSPGAGWAGRVTSGDILTSLA